MDERKAFEAWWKMTRLGERNEAWQGWKARAALAATQAGWISVKDRLPDEAGDYLLFRPFAHIPPSGDPNVTIREFYGLGKIGNDRFGGAHEVTHWMPLPAAPESSVASKEE